jgi:hypothetical protein
MEGGKIAGNGWGYKKGYAFLLPGGRRHFHSIFHITGDFSSTSRILGTSCESYRCTASPPSYLTDNLAVARAATSSATRFAIMFAASDRFPRSCSPGFTTSPYI